MGGGLFPLATSQPLRRSLSTGPVLTTLNALLSTRKLGVVSMRFITAATLWRLVYPSKQSPSSISMSCMRTSNALSTSASMASPYVTLVGPLPRRSPTRTMVYVHATSSLAVAAARIASSASHHRSSGAPPGFATPPMTPVPNTNFLFISFQGSTSRRSTPMWLSTTTRFSLGNFPAATLARKARTSSSRVGAYSLARMTPVAAPSAAA
mmetsp:Transcript_10484/g.16750  ORF Transcript_10484/g.16750 Transcript_10484/m.16750 type:complete len:209 (-) Transcript_10484:916-1542(-)